MVSDVKSTFFSDNRLIYYILLTEFYKLKVRAITDRNFTPTFRLSISSKERPSRCENTPVELLRFLT